MSESELWPVDYDTLEKGDNISPEKCESILKIKRDDKHYGIELLKLKLTIETAMLERQKPVVVRAVNDGLRVMLDNEASEYVARRFLSHERGLVRDHLRGGRVDVSKLSDDERKRHERNTQTQAFKLQALQQARRPRLELDSGDSEVEAIGDA